MFRQRFRIQFKKTGDIRFVGHADTMRAFERALRRAGLPLGMSEGFNPHPRMSFPAPLAVGWEGLCEVMEFELSDWNQPEEVARRLKSQLPPGLELVSVKLAPPTGKAQADEADYLVQPDGPDAPRVEPAKIQEFLSRQEVWSERQRKDRVKRDNIRPFVRDIGIEQDGSLRMRIAISPAGSARPDEILAALGVGIDDAREHYRVLRTEVRLRLA